MALVWPTELPQSPLISGFGEGIADGRTLSKPSTGIGKRRAYWSGVQTVSVSFNMNPSQWNLLESFWVALRHGIDPFWIVDVTLDQRPLLDADNISGEILTCDGVPLLIDSSQLVQFAQDPPKINEANTSDRFAVSMSLEVLP